MTNTQAHTYLAGLDRDNNPQSIFVWVLKTSIEKLIITHAMHQQTLKKWEMKAKTIKGQTTKEGDLGEDEKTAAERKIRKENKHR